MSTPLDSFTVLNASADPGKAEAATVTFAPDGSPSGSRNVVSFVGSTEDGGYALITIDVSGPNATLRENLLQRGSGDEYYKITVEKI